jgi:hypothetical protein
MLSLDRKQRITAEGILKHPAVAGDFELAEPANEGNRVVAVEAPIVEDEGNGTIPAGARANDDEDTEVQPAVKSRHPEKYPNLNRGPRDGIKRPRPPKPPKTVELFVLYLREAAQPNDRTFHWGVVHRFSLWLSDTWKDRNLMPCLIIDGHDATHPFESCRGGCTLGVCSKSLETFDKQKYGGNLERMKLEDRMRHLAMAFKSFPDWISDTEVIEKACPRSAHNRHWLSTAARRK